MIKWITRPVKRYLFRPIKRHAKKAAIIYLLGTTPLGYITTALTTQIPISNPQAVVHKLIDGGSVSGAINVATAGLFKPITEQAKNLIGKGQQTLGDLTHNEDLSIKGVEAQDKANEWFEEGKKFSQKANKLAVSAQDALSNVTKFSKKDKTEEQAINALADNMKWDKSTAPNYYVVVGNAEIDEAQFGGPGSITYSEFDELGRTRTAYAHLNYKMVNDEKSQKREDFSSSKEERLSGWPSKNPKVEVPSTSSNKPYKGVLYNRSHLVADSLGGSATRKNAITGTRQQNVGEKNNGGMAYIEDILRKFFENPTNATVYYQVDPLYYQDELIPRSVVIDVKSSDGTIDQKIIVYNTANGYTINYYTAEAKKGE